VLDGKPLYARRDKIAFHKLNLPAAGRVPIGPNGDPRYRFNKAT
jgi:hypothetical protein